MKPKFTHTLKYALQISSMVFTTITIFGMIFSVLGGGLESYHESILRNLMVIFLCVIATIAFSHLQIKLWLRYLLMYATLCGGVLGATWILGRIFEPRVMWDYISAWMMMTGLFAVMLIIGWINFLREKKKAGDENNQ